MLPKSVSKILSTPSKGSVAEYNEFQPIVPNALRQNEIGKKIYSHAVTLRNKIIEWDKFILKGLPLCKRIVAMNLHETEHPPAELHDIMETLTGIIGELNGIVEEMKTIAKQSLILTQLPDSGPVMQTWSVSKFSQEVSAISESYIEELKYKKLVTEIFTEWISHCPTAAITRTYKVLWEVDMKIDRVKPTLMFWEVGMATSSGSSEKL